MPSSKSSKFLVIGLGSMGKRRIRNLLRSGVQPKSIFGYNRSQARCQEVAEKYGIQTATDFSEAMEKFQPDALIICTPPDSHSGYFLAAAKAGKHFFVEHPVNDSGYEDFFKLDVIKGIVAAPSMNWRFNPAIKKIKQLIDDKHIGEILNFQYHMGQYLPDWHVWEDYRDVYFSKKETGACKEMFAFELSWLSYLIGSPINQVIGSTDKISDLEMTADDIYSAIVQYNNQVCQCCLRCIPGFELRNPMKTKQETKE